MNVQIIYIIGCFIYIVEIKYLTKLSVCHFYSSQDKICPLRTRPIIKMCQVIDIMYLTLSDSYRRNQDTSSAVTWKLMNVLTSKVQTHAFNSQPRYTPH